MILDTLIGTSLLNEHKQGVVLGRYTYFPSDQKHSLQAFERSRVRLNNLCRASMSSTPFSELWNDMKQLLVLSHGQAAVEKGFNVNRHVTIVNMKHTCDITTNKM